MNTSINKQLFENSDLAVAFLDTPDAFYNQKAPNLAIEHERPEHRTIIWLKARGLSLAEIAARTGYSVPWVSQVVRQPWAQRQISDILDANGSDTLAEMFAAAAPPAAEALQRLAHDPNVAANVRLGALRELLDRHLGKPKQTVDANVKHVDLDQLSDADLVARLQPERNHQSDLAAEGVETVAC